MRLPAPVQVVPRQIALSTPSGDHSFIVRFGSGSRLDPSLEVPRALQQPSSSCARPSLMDAGGALEDCLRLLRGPSDEHRLAGLLLATRFCQGDDKDSIIRIYNAAGTTFLNRLLKTGMVSEKDSKKASEERDAYLRLSVTILAAFCRIPEIASSEDMVSKVPILLEVIPKMSDPSILDECHELLLSVIVSSEDGYKRAYQHGVIKILASSVSTLEDGSRCLELSIKILQAILIRLPLDVVIQENQPDMSNMVMAIGRQFGILHTALKFDALHLLDTILSSESAVEMHDLRLNSSDHWAAYVRIGIIAVLQNRIASEEKHHALGLANSMMLVLGGRWLLNCNNIAGYQDHLPVNKCMLLILESARVEVAVLLNEQAYLKYGEPGNHSSTMEAVLLKQRSLAILFSLLEKIIKLISNESESEGPLLSEHTLMKAINGIDETIHLVLDFLTDAKEHEQRKGDDLLASVRLLGSYLAEAPFACRDKVNNLLEYILSVEGMEEQRPFYSVCFMLPMLCQTTADTNGCKTLISSGSHRSIVEFLTSIIIPGRAVAEDRSVMLLACDIIKNLFLNKDKLRSPLEVLDIVHLLQAVTLWTENSNDSSVILSASSICVLSLDCTTENDLLEAMDFDQDTLRKLSQLMARGLDISRQVNDSHDLETLELCQIIDTGYPCLIERFPSIQSAGISKHPKCN